MKEIFGVWANTRQIVIVAVTAAVYAGTLIPFKPIQIIPGLTELRPASVIPVLFGIMFGPAAAWGSAIGNLIADFFGMLTPASAFGFAGNFIYSYAAFAVWKLLVKGEVVMNLKQSAVFVLAAFTGALLCGLTVGLGVWVFKLAPFAVVFTVVLANNTVMASVLGLILMKLLYKRVEKTGLMYGDSCDNT
ncbi:MAG TPA: QueT transporter family protein [Candidatus Goldiibacteriota bacterium]|nr:QueT transporter family protein [Candidatus Goldiibacteriota bacterium]